MCWLWQVNKVVLAYSGGLDTSVILKWLQETYDCEVVTFTADLGQVRVTASLCPTLVHSLGLGSADFCMTAYAGMKADGIRDCQG